jgi:hypothetical protein
MLLFIISSICIIIVASVVLLKLIRPVTSIFYDTKIKKDDSAISLVALDILDPSPVKTGVYSQANTDSELRQRPNHVALDLSNLPRPGQVSSNSNQSTERRVSGSYNVVNSSSMRWQKLNCAPPVPTPSDCRHVALNIPHLDLQNSNNVHFAPKGVGLRGTKPLITINRLDLLASPKHTAAPQDQSTPRLTPRKIPSPKGDATPDISFTTLRLQDLKIDIVIGGGGFGQVWRGSWNGTPVAVKILNAVCQSTVPSSVINDFEEEIRLLARLRHPNICMFLGACLEPPNRAIVTELVSRGTLWDLLRNPTLFSNMDPQMLMPMQQDSKKRLQFFHWPIWVTRKVFEGTTRGLIYLHKQDIIHRGLKSLC